MSVKFLLIISTILLSECAGNTNPVNTHSSNNLKDSAIILQHLLGFNDNKLSSLLLINDTIFLATPKLNVKSENSDVRIFMYDFEKAEFKFEYNSGLNLTETKLKSYSINAPIFMETLDHPKIVYVDLPGFFKTNAQLKELLKDDPKIKLFSNKYYIIDKISPKEIKVYDSGTKKMDSYNISGAFMEVTDFFLYDIDKDQNPEIFILSKGDVPRDEVISYSIYSFRKDSAKVNYK